MSLSISNLKESNTFLNVLFDNLTSAIFLVDQNLKVKNVNFVFETFFNKSEEEVQGQLCGEAIGCSFTIDENKTCGTTSHCTACELRKCIIESFGSKSDFFRKILIRQFYIDNTKVRKYFQFTTRFIFFNNCELVVLIVDDITETEEQKNIIKEKEQEITDSIRYAKNIQNKVLPQDDILTSIFPDSFIIFKPRDIVSGDFYWVYKKDNYIYCSVADCTGHGVPGAFMSLIGISLLNEILDKMGIIAPSVIIGKLRDLIIEVLNQKGITSEVKDGMDIIMIALNMATLECEYAGANNSLFLIRDNKNPERFIEIKPDKMPVGIYENMHPFTNHRIQLEKGDVLYLRTDGFEDQFGGPENKKFMVRHLKELLLSMSPASLVEQKNILEAAFENWKGDYSQIDDVTIMGIKI